MFRTIVIGACSAMLAFAPLTASAQQDPAGPSETVMTDEEFAAAFAKARDEFEATITRRTGVIDAASGRVKVTVPAGYYYLDHADTREVLEELWGNAPDETPDGMLFPEKYSPFDEKAWGVIVSFEETGYVSDSDAAKINYDDLLHDIQKGQRDANPELKRLGYNTAEVVGWATSPRYDSQTHKLYWAKDLIFNGGPEHTLNYDMRVLGRRGVLILQFVASLDQLSEIEAASPTVLAAPEFQPGNRYEDFDPRTDAKADFGIAGLIAGGAGAAFLAKKVGLLGVILVFLKKGWVIIAAAFAGIGGLINRFSPGAKAKAAKAAAERGSAISKLDDEIFGRNETSGDIPRDTAPEPGQGAPPPA